MLLKYVHALYSHIRLRINIHVSTVVTVSYFVNKYRVILGYQIPASLPVTNEFPELKNSVIVKVIQNKINMQRTATVCVFL